MNYIRTLRIVTLWETQNWLQINVVIEPVHAMYILILKCYM